MGKRVSNKKMKKLIYIFLVLLTTSCSVKEQIPCDYPYIDLLVEGYYRGNYEYPQNVYDFLSYYDLKEMKKLNRYIPITIRRLKKERHEISWNLDSDILFVSKNNDTIYYETAIRNPCEELDYNIGLYIANRFFDKEGRYFYTEKLDSNFRKGLKEIFINNDGDKYDSNCDIILLKYTSDTGLVSFCEDASINIKFYDALSAYIENFVIENKLSKVLFIYRKYQ